MNLQRDRRASSIELLKIIAILLIIVSHVVQTLTSKPAYFPSKDYVLDITKATTEWGKLMISMLRYSGVIGNTIFFFSSAWFLVERRGNDKRKLVQLFLDSWFISVLILVIYLLCTVGLDRRLVVKSLFPVISGNNWYVICYMLFLLVYPFLNDMIDRFTQRELARVSSFLFLLYIVLIFALRIYNKLYGATSFFGSDIIYWVSIYFFLAYMKKYRMRWMDSVNLNVVLAFVGFVGTYGLVLLTNALGLKYKDLSNALLIWNVNNNVFVILMVVGVFNIARRSRFSSKTVNYISGLSLFIYMIHENIIVRSLSRPAIWQYTFTIYGHRHDLRLIVLISMLIFMASTVCSVLYRQTLYKGTVSLNKWIYPRLLGQFHKLENWYLNL